jgi:hypothetical protein
VSAIVFFGLNRSGQPRIRPTLGSEPLLAGQRAAIAPHIPVIDKSNRSDGTRSRDDFTFDKAAAAPAGASGKGSNIRRRRPTNLLPDFYNEIGRNPH